MLVLSRKRDEAVLLTMTREQIESLLAQAAPEKDTIVFSGIVRIVDIRGTERVRVGLELPPQCHILREEIATEAAPPPTQPAG
jgi:sRNA-binding carbon storage regulator CsrA